MTARIVLIGCGKAKREIASPARELYTGPLFKARRRHAEAAGHLWFIVSAKCGLVEPSAVLEPYDMRLKGSWAKAWGTDVMGQLSALLAERGLSLRECEIEIHAGRDYADGIRHGGPCSRFLWPVEGMGVGEQLAFYAAHSSKRSPVMEQMG